MRYSKRIVMIILLVSIIAATNTSMLLAVSTRSISKDGYGAEIIVNGKKMDKVLLHDQIPFISLREASGALGKDLTYDGTKKLTYIYEAGENGLYEENNTDYKYNDDIPWIPTVPSYFHEYMIGWDSRSVYPKVGFENKFRSYAGYAVEAGLNIAEYEKKNTLHREYVCLTTTGEAGVFDSNSENYIERNDSLELYMVRIKDGVLEYPVITTYSEIPDTDLSSNAHTSLAKGEAYIDIRQFVVGEEYINSLALIHEDSTYVPLSFLICGLGAEYHFDEKTKASYIGEVPEGITRPEYETIEVEVEGKAYAIPMLAEFLPEEEVAMELIPYEERWIHPNYGVPQSRYIPYYQLEYDFSFTDYPMERYLDFYNEYRAMQPEHNHFGIQRIYTPDNDPDILLTLGSSVGYTRDVASDDFIINLYYDFSIENSGHIYLWVYAKETDD